MRDKKFNDLLGLSFQNSNWLEQFVVISKTKAVLVLIHEWAVNLNECVKYFCNEILFNLIWWRLWDLFTGKYFYFPKINKISDWLIFILGTRVQFALNGDVMLLYVIIPPFSKMLVFGFFEILSNFKCSINF